MNDKEGIEPKVNDKKYKIKFSQKVKAQDDTFNCIDIVVRIMAVDKEKYAVEFTKNNGNNVQFHEIYDNLLKNVLNFSNDAQLA